MHPAVEAGLHDWRVFNEHKVNGSHRWWATFEAIQFEGAVHPVVRVTYGVIHHNGFKECALGTVSYVMIGDELQIVKM